MQDSNSDEFSLKVQVTPGEAYFLKAGSPHRARKEEAPDNPDSLKNPLLQFDLKFDFLRDLLGNVTTVINQHASLLNKLQLDVCDKPSNLDIANTMKQLSISSNIKEQDINKILNGTIQSPFDEKTNNVYNNAMNMFSNRLEMFSQGFGYLHNTNKDLNERFQKLETLVSQKVNQEDFKAKIKKTKKTLRDEIKSSFTIIEDTVQNVGNKLTEKVDSVQGKLLEVEKHTLWRIKDCEDLLKSRINETYVNDSMKKLEEKLKIEINKFTARSDDDIQKTIREVLVRMKMVEDSSDEKLGLFKKTLKELETIVTKKLDVSRFEDFEKAMVKKIDQGLEDTRSLGRRCEPAITRLEQNFKNMNDAFNKLTHRLDNISVSMQNFLLIGNLQKKEDKPEARKRYDSEDIKQKEREREKEREKEREREREQEKDEISSQQMTDIQVILAKYNFAFEKINEQILEIQEVILLKNSLSI